MAQSARDQLFDTLRANGLRKRTAKILSEAAGAGRSAPGRSTDLARTVIADLRRTADDLEARITGKATSSDRKKAAAKAARTRDRNAKKRSASAKKAAATRKRSSSTSSGTRTAAKRTASSARTTAKRASTTAKRASSSTAKRGSRTAKKS